MDTSNGHIVEDIELVDEKDKAKYTQIPSELHSEAAEFLKKNSGYGYYNLTGNTALAEWARAQKAKSRSKNKMAKASRKANRGSNRGR